MRGHSLFKGFKAAGLSAIVLAVFAVTLLATSSHALTEKVVHTFAGTTTDGLEPYAALILDAAGNLYGTTYKDGAFGVGTVFELSPVTGGGWTETVLYSFNNNGTDGFYPFAGLIFDGTGNLYGTTFVGGTNGAGAVFELTPAGGGLWTETVLYSFNPAAKDGSNPYASLIFDTAGNLYGTTVSGGAYNNGAVFELSPVTGGGWTETVLHSFNPHARDGADPFGGVILDKAGNLYGATSAGGVFSYGTVFELSPKTGGVWTEKVLHSFNNNGKDGYSPFSGLISDAAGNLYGTTLYGGFYNLGAVFEFMPRTGGVWTEKLLLNVDDRAGGGNGPYGGVIFDATGNLYGTTFYGGTYGYGVVFELSPKASGAWTQRVLHSFNNNGKDGFDPFSGLVIDTAGNLYGTTLEGGPSTFGTVFEITP